MIDLLSELMMKMTVKRNPNIIGKLKVCNCLIKSLKNIISNRMIGPQYVI
jgi:hypothetical protein